MRGAAVRWAAVMSLALAACASDGAAVLDRTVTPDPAAPTTLVTATDDPATTAPVTTGSAPPATEGTAGPTSGSYRASPEQLDAAVVRAADLEGATPGDPNGPVLLYPCTDTPAFSDMTTSPGADVKIGDRVRIGSRLALNADTSTAWADRWLTGKAGCTHTHDDGVIERVETAELVDDLPADEVHSWSVVASFVLPGKGAVAVRSTYVQKARLVAVVQCVFSLASTADDVAQCATALRTLGTHMAKLLTS